MSSSSSALRPATGTRWRNCSGVIVRRPTADALDAVQDGFVKALTHLDTFQGRSSFKTWLLRVVSNAALDLGRQRGRRETFSLNGVASANGEAYHPMRFDNPTAGLEQQDLRQALDAALATLSDAQRQTFVLHAEAGLSYREVAEALDISIGTVMSRLYYTRQKLRACLGDWMVPGEPEQRDNH